MGAVPAAGRPSFSLHHLPYCTCHLVSICSHATCAKLVSSNESVFAYLQVQTKLKLAGIDSIFLVSVCLLHMRMRVHSRNIMSRADIHVSTQQSGEKVTRLDDLQDIDELHVTEVGSLRRGDHFTLLSVCAIP